MHKHSKIVPKIWSGADSSRSTSLQALVQALDLALALGLKQKKIHKSRSVRAKMSDKKLILKIELGVENNI